MSDNVKVLVVGAGAMAKEYCKVLLAQNYIPVVIGRGKENAEALEKEFGVSVITGGLEKGFVSLSEVPEFAIVAIDVLQLAEATKFLLNKGIKNILVEKPGALQREELKEVCELSEQLNAHVYVAYNRRFYASVDKAMEIIEKDGGVTSFNFEFTEWAHLFRNVGKERKDYVRKTLFIGNSTHVMDLAFFLGGFPTELSSYATGEIDIYQGAAIYAGAGVSEKGALFSYQANWDAPGRWVVEILTKKHRLYFKPMEKLQIQELASVAVNPVEIDDRLDVEYKAGFYRQVESFIKEIDDGKKVMLDEQIRNFEIYKKMENK